MTDSMIPYSFTPGTKAKAGEVNANFIALASFIEANKNNSNQNLEELNNILQNAVDQLATFEYKAVTEASTDLNDYKTTGSFVFNEDVIPKNRPMVHGVEKGKNAILNIRGSEDSLITQEWNAKDNCDEKYSRLYKDGAWSNWKSSIGDVNLLGSGNGVLQCSNGLLIQWGNSGSYVTFSLAYKELPGIAIARIATGNISALGVEYVSNTGFGVQPWNTFYGYYWIAIGYKEV